MGHKYFAPSLTFYQQIEVDAGVLEEAECDPSCYANCLFGMPSNRLRKFSLQAKVFGREACSLIGELRDRG